MNLSPLPVQKFFDNNGRPLVGGLLFTYEAGTTTKVATYSNAGGTLNSNPVVLDYRGECRIWLDPIVTYKFVLAPAGDTDPPTKPIWTVDDIATPSNPFYARSAAEVAAGVTPANYSYPWLNVLRYGTNTNPGTTDMGGAIQDAINVAAVFGGTVVVPEGTYLITSPLLWAAQVNVQGSPGASKIVADGCACIRLDFATAFGDIVLDGLWLDGVNGSTHAAIEAPGQASINDQLYGLTIRNVLITNFNTGIYLRAVHRFVIDDVWAQGVDNGIIMDGLCLLGWVTNFMGVWAGGAGGSGETGITINASVFDEGTQPCEGIQIDQTQTYGFPVGFNIDFCNAFSLEQFDISATEVGFQFSTAQHGMSLGFGFINMQGAAATHGVLGFGLASSIATAVKIKDVSVLGSSAAASTLVGIQINGAANTNQFHVDIEGGSIDGCTLYDVLLNNPGDSHVRGVKCFSAAANVLASIKVGPRQAGLITVQDCQCADVIETVTADAIAGTVRTFDNIVSGTAFKSSSAVDWYEQGTWTPVDASGAALAFSATSGVYTKIGNMVFASFFITYPATANASPNLVGGLPYAGANDQGARQGNVSYSSAATITLALPSLAGQTFAFRVAGGAIAANSVLTGAVLYGQISYPVSV